MVCVHDSVQERCRDPPIFTVFVVKQLDSHNQPSNTTLSPFSGDV